MNHQANRSSTKTHTGNIRRKIHSLKNQMDFVEILCNFWPLPNMKAKHKRLKAECDHLETQLQTSDKTLPEYYAPIFIPPVPQYTAPVVDSSRPVERIQAGNENPFMRRAFVHAN